MTSDLMYEITKWATPPLTLILIYFIKDFKTRVEADLSELKQSVGKAAIDLAERTADIKVSLAKMDSVCEIAKEKVSLMTQAIEGSIHKLETRVDGQREIITGAAKVLKKHSEEIAENQDAIRRIMIDKNNYRRNGTDDDDK